MDDRRRALVRLSASLTRPETQPEIMDEVAQIAPEAAEEVLLQSYLFLGFPVALNSLGLWRRRTGRPPPEATSVESNGYMDRGVEVCRAVYAGKYDALREVMQQVHPDLDRWAITEGYGKVLGRGELDLVTRELCVAALLAGLGMEASRQLHAHLRGCLNVGADVDEVDAVLEAIDDVLDPSKLTEAQRVWSRVRQRWLATSRR
jgi:4-carboxymuconolactone decarboxylase